MNDKIDELDNIEPEELTQANAWPPIPDSEIFKGATLTPARLIELGAISGSPMEAQWAFRILRLRDEIMERSKREGSPLSVRISKGGLHINTDAQATIYHDDRGELAMSSVRRQVQALATLIDPSKLSSAEQVAHDRKLCLWGARMASLKRATKAITSRDDI